MDENKTVDKYAKSEKELMDLINRKKDGFHARVTSFGNHVQMSFTGDLEDILEGITMMLEDLINEWGDENEEDALSFGQMLGRLSDMHDTHLVDNLAEDLANAIKNGMLENDEENEEQEEKYLA